MGKQKRKQAEPDVSNKMLKLNRKSKMTTKPGSKTAAATSLASSPKGTPSANPKAVRSPGPGKPEKTRPSTKAASKPSQPLPTIANDVKLKQIADKTREVEKKAVIEEEEQQQRAPLAAVSSVSSPEGAVREVVKVRRSNPSLKLRETTAKSYLSISGGPAEDDKTVKVPSYSYMKNRGIVYISHIPHGFYEKQMRDFFSQFGIITNLRLGRSKKTGRSRGFAFVEFKYEEVAKVVAETMNNYLMFDKILKVELVSGARKSRAIFMGKINPNRPPLLKSRMNAKVVHNSEKCAETELKRQARQLQKLARLTKRLATAGVQYEVKLS